MSVSVVAGGTVVTPAGTARADVLIRDGAIASVSTRQAAEGWDAADSMLDASGCYVLPGGVDPHCHLMAAAGQATAAAARGGTTTVLSFTSPASGESTLAALRRSRAELEQAPPVIDVGLHAAVYDPDQVSDADLVSVREVGAAAIKIFLAYAELGIMCSTSRMYELMGAARSAGLLVQVHCENGPLIEAIEELVLSGRAMRRPAPTAEAGGAGQADTAAEASGAWQASIARMVADTRPAEAEEEAVARALLAARAAEAACYLVHLSSAGAVAQVRMARSTRRPPAFAEACIHHLVLDDSCYTRADAIRFLVAPPLRPDSQVEALWDAIADGTIDTVGSDHCQRRTLTAGRLAVAGLRVPYGLAGVGPRLPLLLSAALARGVPITRVAQLASEHPARVFGHYPRKGAILPGADADLVVFDPDGQTTLPDDGFGDGSGDSVYAGLTLRGSIRAVLARGRTIVSEGALIDQPPAGLYLPASAQRATQLNAYNEPRN